MEIMPAIAITHIGEPLVAALLQELDAKNRLRELYDTCKRPSLYENLNEAGVTDPCFLAESAALSICFKNKKEAGCDGAQKVDVLCTQSSAKFAWAIEVKLGVTRMSHSAFYERYYEMAELSSHKIPRVRGSMISVLARNFKEPLRVEDITASNDGGSWEVQKTWWLVIRRQVWRSWQTQPSIEGMRVLLLEDMVRLFEDIEGFGAFNRLAESLWPRDPYREWKLGDN